MVDAREKSTRARFFIGRGGVALLRWIGNRPFVRPQNRQRSDRFRLFAGRAYGSAFPAAHFVWNLGRYDRAGLAAPGPGGLRPRDSAGPGRYPGMAALGCEAAGQEGA